jgi:HK97 family phage portal protein
MAFWGNLFKRRGPESAETLLGKLVKMPLVEVKGAMSTLDLFRELYGGYETSTGASVNHETALEASTALACARVISEGLFQIPFRLMQSADGKRLPASTHPVYALLNDSPNPFQSPTDFMDMLGMHLVFAGNFYAYKLIGTQGQIVGLLPLMPHWVCPDLNTESWRMEYEVTFPNGKYFKLSSAELWHVRGPTWNGWQGLDGVKLAREAIGLSVAQQNTAGASVKNGVRLQGFLTTDQPMDKKQRDALRESWQETFGGAANAGKIGVMSNGMKFMPMQQTNNDAQFLEQRQFQVEEICRLFRVMPIMIGYSGDKANTYASAEQMFLAHVVHTMGPWYKRVESSANSGLLTAEERRRGFYTKFFTQGLLRGAASDRAEFYTKLYGIGAINPNEIRDLEDMNPYDGGERYAVPLNMVSPDIADEVQQAKTQPAQKVPQPMAGASTGTQA